MQFWKQDMVQSADTESKEEAEQLLVRNNFKLSSVHLKQPRYSELVLSNFTHILTNFCLKFTVFLVSGCNDT